MAQAQSTPIVEINLSQPQAHQGDTVSASIYIRNAQNIGGADIGMMVDETCLKIVGLQRGAFLSGSGNDSLFEVINQVNDHDARFAAALTDRTKVGTGTGNFYHITLEVICEQGIAPLNITFAELSAYKDPSASEIELTAYTLASGNLEIHNTELEVIPGSLEVEELGLEQISDRTEPASGATEEKTLATSQNPADLHQDTNILAIIVPLWCTSMMLILLAMFVVRRKKRRQVSEH
ncbi:hypothetical protein G4Y79_16765 [Phototrophicus methaneseepsis]|uniref:Cohesin domain-containing protein n=1 Tax=Phototrophicus methaneseepsis TaxID=2710758 RepID=A0A7S8E6M7_9CHLR|nr:cohesin domain-containing protein [Phototrophicus methaneseepsis]QPC81341.1 hypothetical protein G4Y79_16765 [Phototrophicus methaneseepsis]